MKSQQLEIPIYESSLHMVHERENNKESQTILEANRQRLTKQCQMVLDLLKSGIRLTVRDAMINYGIGDLRRRIADLKENGIEIQSKTMEGGFKIWWIEKPE